MTPPPIVPPTVLATAFVRSRDGRSILDRDPHGREPVKAYAADPERLHRAVTALGDLGITVDTVDLMTISCRGPAPVFESAFAIRLVYDSGPGGAGSPAWRVAGTTGFDVGSATAFGSLLHRVVLRSPAAPATQAVWFPVEPASVATTTPRDLLLGELGETFGTGLPPRHARGEVLDLADRDAATRRTATSLKNWADNLDRDGLATHIERMRALQESDGRPRHPRPKAVISEFAALEKMIDGFAQLRGAGPPPLHVTPSTTAEDDVLEWRFAWPDQKAFDLARRRREAKPTIDEVAESLEDCETRAGSGELTAGMAEAMRPALRALGSAVREIVTVVAGLHDNGPLDGWDKPDVQAVVDLIEAMVPTNEDMPRPVTREALQDVFDRLAWILRWCSAHSSALADDSRTALEEAYRHATMVGSVFLAVTLDVVEVTLLASVDPVETFWTPPAEVGKGPLVISGSVSGTLPDGFAGKEVSEMYLSSARLSPAGSNRLYVLAAGNRPRPGDPDGPSVAVLYTADTFTNVLTVGGCSPGPSGWVACERTHGYAVKPTVAGAAGPFSLPHVCSVAEGNAGGGVLYPETVPPARGRPPVWLRGGGTSVATPIVAALCALVWSAFPSLTAGEVRTAVLAGTDKIDKESFYVPTLHGQELTSPEARNNLGACRAVLQKVLSHAQHDSGIAYTSEHPALDPAPAVAQ